MDLNISSKEQFIKNFREMNYLINSTSIRKTVSTVSAAECKAVRPATDFYEACKEGWTPTLSHLS